MAKHRQWHIGGVAAWLLLPIAMPAALIAGWLSRPSKLSAKDVAGYIDNFLSDRGGSWDWDDFTSIPIADPELEAIRREAAVVRLPLDRRGRAKLASLLERVRRLGLRTT